MVAWRRNEAGIGKMLLRGRSVAGKKDRMCKERHRSIKGLGEYREWGVLC